MRTLIMLAAMVLATSALSRPLSVPDRKMDRYFAIWANNAAITSSTVASIYADRVQYYGKFMSTDAVYRDKLNYIRQWPQRSYDVVPGSVAKVCDVTETHCRVTAVLQWRKADQTGRHANQGANTVSLDLVRQDGILKIARESGSPVVSAVCTGRRCSGFR